MSKYKEDLKRKDRNIENCQDIQGVLKDMTSGLIDLQEAKQMLWIAMQTARTDGYMDGWSKTKQVKKR